MMTDLYKKLSVFMITKNEEQRLPRTLKAIKSLADEIVIVDSGSTDNTVRVAEEYGARVYFREWDNYSAQKKYAESLCTGGWLMNLDADEELTPELALEIREVIEKDLYDMCKLRVSDVRYGSSKPYKWVHYYKIMRLYKRGTAHMADTYTADRPQVIKNNTRCGLLKGFVLHHSFVSIHQQIEKFNNYSSAQVEALAAQGKSYSPFRILFAMNLCFLKEYILHRGFLKGYWGYIDAVNVAFLQFMKYSKYYEYSHKK